MASGQDEHSPMLWCSFSLCRCSLAWPSRRQKLTAHVGQSGFFVWASPFPILSCMLCSFFPPAVICFQKWREEFAGHWRKYFRNSCEHVYSRIYAMGTVFQSFTIGYLLFHVLGSQRWKWTVCICVHLCKPIWILCITAFVYAPAWLFSVSDLLNCCWHFAKIY